MLRTIMPAPQEAKDKPIAKAKPQAAKYGNTLYVTKVHYEKLKSHFTQIHLLDVSTRTKKSNQLVMQIIDFKCLVLADRSNGYWRRFKTYSDKNPKSYPSYHFGTLKAIPQPEAIKKRKKLRMPSATAEQIVRFLRKSEKVWLGNPELEKNIRIFCEAFLEKNPKAKPDEKNIFVKYLREFKIPSESITLAMAPDFESDEEIQNRFYPVSQLEDEAKAEPVDDVMNYDEIQNGSHPVSQSEDEAKAEAADVNSDDDAMDYDEDELDYILDLVVDDTSSDITSSAAMPTSTQAPITFASEMKSNPSEHKINATTALSASSSLSLTSLAKLPFLLFRSAPAAESLKKPPLKPVAIKLPLATLVGKRRPSQVGEVSMQGDGAFKRFKSDQENVQPGMPPKRQF